MNRPMLRGCIGSRDSNTGWNEPGPEFIRDCELRIASFQTTVQHSLVRLRGGWEHRAEGGFRLPSSRHKNPYLLNFRIGLSSTQVILREKRSASK